MEYRFDPEKDEWLLTHRGVSFSMVLEAIAEGKVLLIFTHPNQADYPGQQILVVELAGYPYCVPFVEQEGARFLKTVYPNRKFKSLIVGERTDE